MDEPMTIGAFARRSRLSPKALRLYEKLGLLAPDDVDPVNGYRRYRESQLATARLLALLRRLDMPLARVADVLAAPGSRRVELVVAYWAAVERRVASQRELVAHLRNTLSGGEGSYDMYDVHEREVPEQTVLTEQRHLRIDELDGWITAAGGRLLSAAEPYGGAAGSAFVIYHGEVNEDSDGPVEVCLPVAASGSAAATRLEPAHREAYVRLTKAQTDYPQILSAYDAVSQWLTAHGRAMSGSPREVYFVDFLAAGPTDEVCDVAFPY